MLLLLTCCHAALVLEGWRAGACACVPVSGLGLGPGLGLLPSFSPVMRRALPQRCSSPRTWSHHTPACHLLHTVLHPGCPLQHAPPGMMLQPSQALRIAPCTLTLHHPAPPRTTLHHPAAGHESWVLSVSCHPDGGAFASGSSDSKVKLWDLGTRTCSQTVAEHSDQVGGGQPGLWGWMQALGGHAVLCGVVCTCDRG